MIWLEFFSQQSGAAVLLGAQMTTGDKNEARVVEQGRIPLHTVDEPFLQLCQLLRAAQLVGGGISVPREGIVRELWPKAQRASR